MTIQIYKNGNDLILESTFVDLKITSDRKLWVRRNWKKDTNHIDSGVKVPMGMSRVQKEMWLLDFRKKLIEKQTEMLSKMNTHRVPSMILSMEEDESEDEELDEEDSTEEEKELEEPNNPKLSE